MWKGAAQLTCTGSGGGPVEPMPILPREPLEASLSETRAPEQVDIIPVFATDVSLDPESTRRLRAATQLLATPPPRMSGSEGIHVFVFVHGFQGNSYDLRLYKAFLGIMNPKAEMLLSSANESNTLGDIAQMGQNLAEEVDKFLSELRTPVARIRLCIVESLCVCTDAMYSFVGHSLGAVIVRSALTQPAMQQYLPKLFTFVSMSAPHLGTLYSHNTVLDSGMFHHHHDIYAVHLYAGMRLMKSWKRSAALTQLMMEDASSIKNSYLYQLAKQKGIKEDHE